MYRTWLIPYLEGLLDEARRAELEARLADDPALAEELSALRRALPAIRTSLRSHDAPMEAAGHASLWPRLRERLASARPRPLHRLTPLRWAVIIAMTTLLLASSVAKQQKLRHGLRADAIWRQELRHAPLIVFHRDNAAGTRTAARLRQQARRVAAERRAAS